MNKREKKRLARDNSPWIIVRKQSKKILTNENWCPTHEGMVEVFLLEWKSGECRVSVWGHDDLGMEKYFNSLGPAQREFNRLVHLTSKAEMLARNFNYV